jgi:ectoine hydroxylase
MSPEEILNLPAVTLSQTQRERYFEQGFVLIEGLIGKECVDGLRRLAAELESRGSEPDDCPEDFEFETLPDTGQHQIRQVLCAGAYLAGLWDYATTAPLVDIVEDLVGPNIKSMFSAPSPT